MKKAWQIFVAIVLWALFALAGLAGFALGLLAALAGQTAYTGRVFRAMDRMTAVVLNVGDGSKTVSSECSGSGCRFCRALCALLNVVLEPDHCKKEAQEQQV